MLLATIQRRGFEDSPGDFQTAEYGARSVKRDNRKEGLVWGLETLWPNLGAVSDSRTN